MTPDEFVQRFEQARASAILRTRDTERARRAMQAAVEGGFRIVEFTLSVSNVFELIAEFAADGELIVGAGTVLTPEQARQAVDAGAQFLVSPVVDEAVIHQAAQLGVAAMPGCSTPTEMLRAHRAGAAAETVPRPGHRTCLDPPDTRSPPFPEDRAHRRRGRTERGGLPARGATAVGFVNTLFDPQDIEAGNWDAISQRAARMLAAVGD